MDGCIHCITKLSLVASSLSVFILLLSWFQIYAKLTIFKCWHRSHYLIVSSNCICFSYHLEELYQAHINQHKNRVGKIFILLKSTKHGSKCFYNPLLDQDLYGPQKKLGDVKGRIALVSHVFWKEKLFYSLDFL